MIAIIPLCFIIAENCFEIFAVNSAPFLNPRSKPAIMKQEQAKRLLIQEWDDWIQKQATAPSEPTGRDSLKFFLDLKDARSPLLNFQTRGRDKWRVVHDWLLGAGRVR
jgi:hypothetical protein